MIATERGLKRASSPERGMGTALSRPAGRRLDSFIGPPCAGANVPRRMPRNRTSMRGGERAPENAPESDLHARGRTCPGECPGIGPPCAGTNGLPVIPAKAGIQQTPMRGCGRGAGQRHEEGEADPPCAAVDGAMPSDASDRPWPVLLDRVFCYQ